MELICHGACFLRRNDFGHGGITDDQHTLDGEAGECEGNSSGNDL